MDPESRGERAAQILDSEVYREAVSGARQQIKDDWTKAKASAEREALWHEFQAVERVTRALKIIRDRGIIERNKREKEQASG